MTAYEAGATNEPVLTEDQLKRLARHRYSAAGQSLLEPYMQVTQWILDSFFFLYEQLSSVVGPIS